MKGENVTEAQGKNYWGTCFKQEAHVVTREIIGETILVPIQGKLADMQRIFTLNDVGAYIWSNLDGEKDLEKICQGLEATFEVGREQAESDLKDFISELMDAELILGDV
jgi:hypothetical protein